MSAAERKRRELAEREACIVATARRIAEAEGWSAVTIRRLADEIEYSQPVLYSHFENRDAIVSAVAVEGFRDLTRTLGKAIQKTSDHRDAIERTAIAYLGFAHAHPALYEAMFTLPTGLRFAEAGTVPELKAAFAALAAIVAPADSNIETATETFWAVLHGLAELEASGRIRPGMRDERVALVVRGMLSW